MTWTAIDPRIWQAVIAGAFLAIGWLVNGWQNRKADERRYLEGIARDREQRAERIRDIHRALFAEISAHVHNLGSEALLDGYEAQMAERFAAEPSHVPLIPTEQDDMIFRAVTGEIHILTRTSIDAVVLFYRQLRAIATLARDMRSTAFANAETSSKLVMYGDYIEMKKQALRYGLIALRLIEVYAEDGPEAARLDERAIRDGLVPPRPRRAVNTPGAVRSDRSSE
ncbi:hypothetical protein [Tropicimonas sp. IMCC34011]|uniref:hypothetical protein n=1 Tax=Tropicimonas sp. IMCC34011 TaxID=2248759 RepID=UPI000E26B02F|nr:hypothetical protein [Tropicimonas sp. IMCC34011]